MKTSNLLYPIVIGSALLAPAACKQNSQQPITAPPSWQVATGARTATSPSSPSAGAQGPGSDLVGEWRNAMSFSQASSNDCISWAVLRVGGREIPRWGKIHLSISAALMATMTTTIFKDSSCSATFSESDFSASDLGAISGDDKRSLFSPQSTQLQYKVGSSLGGGASALDIATGSSILSYTSYKVTQGTLYIAQDCSDSLLQEGICTQKSGDSTSSRSLNLEASAQPFPFTYIR